MQEDIDIIEYHLFVSESKINESFRYVFEWIFLHPVDNILIQYIDKPDEFYSTVNSRTKKILLNLDKPEKIESVTGHFSEGGQFKIIGNKLFVFMAENEYNYFLLEALKNFLGFIFPIWLFKNPYIWGANLFEQFDTGLFREVAGYVVKSKLLEEPEVEIYKRDDGLIQKFRFFVNENFETTEEGLRFLATNFSQLHQAVQKKNYEGYEVFYYYCFDRFEFRKFEPRTKIGKQIKSILSYNN